MADDVKVKRVTEYDEATTFGDNDYIFVDNVDLGTRKIKSTTIKQSLTTDQQIAAINAAGQAARDSIPGTYTELSDSVSDLESTVEYIVSNEAYYGVENLFDKSDVDITQGGYINDSDEFVADASIRSTGYIPVEVGNNYTASRTNFFVNWYDENKNLLGKSSSHDFVTNGYVTPLPSSAYARFVFYMTDFPTAYVTRFPIYRTLKKTANWDETVATGTLAFSEKKNLFNIGDCRTDGYYSDSQTFVQSASIGQTNYVEIDANCKYKTSTASMFALWYDHSKTYLGRSNGDPSGNYVPIVGSKYGKFLFYIENVKDFYIYSNSKSDYDVSFDSLSSSNPLGSFGEQKNLFNPFDVDINMDGFYSATNEFTPNANLASSGFIPVEEGYIYSSPTTDAFVNWYDANKNFINSTPSITYTKLKFAIPTEGAKFARFIFYKKDRLTFYVKSNNPADVVFNNEKKQSYLFQHIYSNMFKDRVFVSFGDSITAQNKWQPIVSGLLGLTHYNCGIGSTSLSGPYVNNNTELPSFWMPTRLNAIKEKDPDIITILGGANDILQSNLAVGSEDELSYTLPIDAVASQGASEYNASSSYSLGSYCTRNSVRYECKTAISGGETWNESHWKAVKNVDTFIGAYSYIVEYLLLWKRTLTIVILGTTWAQNDGTGHSHGVTYSMLSNASKKVAEHYGLPFIDLHGKLGFNKYTLGSGSNAIYSDDQLHPNWKGAERIAKLVLSSFVNDVSIY